MTRSQVITDLITKYDKVVTGQDKSAIELAVFKIAICQLVDAAFSGGGGGGTTIGTVSDGIDGSIDINTIITRLSSIDTNQLTQAGVVAAIQSAADIDTVITKLTAIETNTAGGGGGGGGTSSATIATGINDSTDIDTILSRLTSLDTSKLTQSGVEAAIQSAADIDTIIARLTTIASNTSGGAANTIASYIHSIAAITDAGVIVKAANSSRKGLAIINRSATNPVDLFFGAVGSYGTGLPLAAGQSYEINTTNLYAGVVNAITSSGITVTLAVAEGI